jgi:hypothetical protein
MERFYEASWYDPKAAKYHSADFGTEAEAKAAIEANGFGRMVKFVQAYGDIARSCAMDTYDAGVWASHDITR